MATLLCFFNVWSIDEFIICLYSQANQKSQSERDHAKSQFLEAQRTAQTANADVEQAQKRVSS